MVAGDGMVAERADLIVRNAKVTTLADGRGAVAEAVAARGERFAAVGDEAEVMRLAGEGTWVVGAGRLRVIPGAQRLAPARDPRRLALQPGAALGGGSAAWRGLEMIREQADRTPQGQWVRVMGGWSPYQFTEKADADRGGAEQGGSAGARTGPVRLQPGAAGFGTAAPRLSAASAPPRGHCEFADGGGSACVISQSLLSGRRSTRPPRERANPRANAGRHQATPSYVRRLLSQVKCPVSHAGRHPATGR